MTLKTALKNKKTTVGSWITLGDPAVAEIMARSGFDWLAIDMEHSSVTFREAEALIRVIDLCGVSPLVRVGENNPYLIKRVMDAGAHGVIVPMVNSREDAVKAVNAVQYPPSGTRGVGLARAQGYGMGFEAYKKWLQKESVVIVQIEHRDAVDNLEEIFSVEGIDGFIVGPYDLSGSLGSPGDFSGRRFLKALQKIKEAAKKFPLAPGYHVVAPDKALLQKKINEGYRFVGFSLDTLFLAEKCAQGLKGVRTKK